MHSCHSGEVTIELDRDSRLKRNPQVVGRALAEPEGGVLLHLESGAYHRFNHVGYIIWEALDEARTVADLVKAVRQRIADAPPGLEQDVHRFLQRALERDLILVD
jgi:hypothetical protein